MRVCVVLVACLVAVQASADRDNWSWGEEGEHSGPTTSASSGRSLASASSGRAIASASSGRAIASAEEHKPQASDLHALVSPPAASTLPSKVVVGTSLNVAPQPGPGEARGETAAVDPAGTEGRFIKEKLCDIGIGFDCKKAYKGYDKGHVGHGLPISPYDVTYVQPVQVVPVGGHIPAVIVNKAGKGHHHAPASYNLPSPSYAPPAPAYSPPAPAYSPPSSSYGAPPSSGYGVPSYTPPKASYGAPASSYSPPVYTPPKAQSVVQHIHTHHHGYSGGSSLGGYSGYGKQNTFSGSSGNFDSFSSSSSSIKKVGAAAPSFSSSSSFNSFSSSCEYECVEPQFCRDHDIVGRTTSGGNLRSLLDARTRPVDILSTAEDKEATKEEAVVEAAAEEVTREKRDTMVFRDDRTGSSQASTATFPSSRREQRQIFGSSVCQSHQVCCRSPFFRQARQTNSCGRRSSFGVLGRVKNNHFEHGDTEFGEYPWQGAILRRDGRDNVYVCGAALIDSRHLLTAAHCLTSLNPFDLKVRLGEWDVGSTTEFYRHVDTNVAGFYLHPQFNSGNLDNDIAVIRLDSAVDLVQNPHITPVCLPDRFAKFTGLRCNAAGWGKNAFGELGDFQSLLKEVSLPMVDQKTCQSLLRRTRLGPGFNLQEGMICAGGEAGADTCEGDGGSPLVCRGQDGSFMVAGLVSWGVGCGTAGVPGVYTNVPLYLDWIRSITRS